MLLDEKEYSSEICLQKLFPSKDLGMYLDPYSRNLRIQVISTRERQNSMFANLNMTLIGLDSFS